MPRVGNCDSPAKKIRFKGFGDLGLQGKELDFRSAKDSMPDFDKGFKGIKEGQPIDHQVGQDRRSGQLVQSVQDKMCG